MTRLPGHTYRGPDSSGFMTAQDFAALLGRYATSFAAPVLEQTTVERVVRDDCVGDGASAGRFLVTTDRGKIRARNVVVATGWSDRPAVPAIATALTERIHQVVPNEYRSPDALPSGGVLVVGASATGVQLADEIHRSGRPVTIAVGSHNRMPRRYRGMDSFWWFEQMRAFDRTIDEVDDVELARREPSLQLVGRPDHSTLDLVALQRLGVRLTGRLSAIDGRKVTFGDDLASTIASADCRMERMLARIDHTIDALGLGREVFPREPIESADPNGSPLTLDLSSERIETVVWATGHVRRYDWLDVPILDGRGEILQHRGVTRVPGAYVLGQRFQHYRNSNFIDGVGRDAEFVADHICKPSTSRDGLIQSRAQQN